MEDEDIIEFTAFAYEGKFPRTGDYYIAVAAINRVGASVSETIQISVSGSIPGYLGIYAATLLSIGLLVFYIRRKMK